MSILPRLEYLTSGLPNAQAYEIWKGVLGALFEPRAFHPSQRYPTGSASGVVVGDMIVARVTFTAQSYRRDRTLIERTPDHFLFHLYNVGGFNGSITGHKTAIWSGHVAIIDLRHEVDTLAASSDTISLIVPRSLLPGLTDAALPPRLDPARNRLLAAHLADLRERSRQLDEAEVSTVTERTQEVISTLLDPTSATDHLEAPALDSSHLSLAEWAIHANLASPDLSPEWLANRLGISRASLYRLFAPYGGIMRSVQERRLLAVRAALTDPLETRLLSRLASDFGFQSEAHFSRSFRAEFGMTASEFRAGQLKAAHESERTSLDILNWWWERLGSRSD